MRDNIFSILHNNWDAQTEIKRLDQLFQQEKIIKNQSCAEGYYSLFDFVNKFLFKQWKGRSRCIDAHDFMKSVDYNRLMACATVDSEDFFSFVEVIYNFWILAYLSFKRNEQYPYTGTTAFLTLQQNMNDCLDHFNHKTYYIKSEEQLLVVEKDAAVTSVAEIAEPDIADAVIQYHHHRLKGDIDKKKEILLKLGYTIEPFRDELKKVNKSLEDDAFFALNNFNLRHNNMDCSSKYYHPILAKMSVNQIEDLYDELFQMLLLAKLELEQINRSKELAEIKKAMKQ
jgi:hypothetical protein